MKGKLKPYIGLFFKVFLPAYLVFIVLTFPTNDIKHKITEMISTATKNQVQVQFDELDLGIFPTPSVGLENVSIFLRNMNPLNVKSLEVSPSILSLITFSPGFSLSSEGIFSGNLDASFRDGSKTKKDISKKILNVKAKKLQLNELLNFLQKRINIQSQVNLNLESEYDPTFAEGIDGTLIASSPSLNMKEVTLPTDLGPIQVPNLSIKNIRLKLEMKNNRWVIQEGKIGQDGDSIFGTIGGDANVKLMATPAGARVSNASYNLDLRLNIEKRFIDQLAFKAIIESYLSNANAKYQALNLKLNASSLRSPPKITKIR